MRLRALLSLIGFLALITTAVVGGVWWWTTTQPKFTGAAADAYRMGYTLCSAAGGPKAGGVTVNWQGANQILEFGGQRRRSFRVTGPDPTAEIAGCRAALVKKGYPASLVNAAT